MALLRKVATFRRIGPLGRSLYFEALALSLALRFSFKLRGVPGTQAALRAWAKPVLPLPPDLLAHVRQAMGMVRRSAGVDGTCLVRTLTMWAMLTRRGISAQPRWGSRKEPGGAIVMHAWLELNGQVINDDPALTATYTAYPDPAWFDLAAKPR